MRSKEVEEAINYFENRYKEFEQRLGKKVTTEEHDYIEILNNYTSDLEKDIDELKIEKNNLINERDKLTEEYNKTGEFVNNQIYRDENYLHKDKIRNLKEKYEKKCAVLGRHSDNLQWYEMGKNFGKVDLCEELLGGQ